MNSMTDTPTPAPDGAELLPCPFCGSDELSHGWSAPGYDGAMSTGSVECHNCNALIYTQDGEAAAIRAWNRRHRLASTEARAATTRRDDAERGEVLLADADRIVTGLAKENEYLRGREKTLEAALQIIARNEAAEFDEDLGHNVIVSMSEEEMADVARLALSAPSAPTVVLVQHMVQRFLSWRLPEHFNPDNGISFTPPFKDEPMRSRHWPIGTNLFTAIEAEAMVRHMIDGTPSERVQAFLDQIVAATPNGEWIEVQYHPNGDWSVAAPSAATVERVKVLEEALREIERKDVTVTSSYSLNYAEDREVRHDREVPGPFAKIARAALKEQRP